MKCGEIIQLLEELAPAFMACSWDNPGLLAGRREKQVSRIYLALDATDQVVEDVIQKKADMLLTHHPLIFAPLKQINDEDFIGRRMLALIENGVSYYAMHTNFDSAPGGMADLAAERIGLIQSRVLEPEGEHEGMVYGIGKVGCLFQPVSLRQLAERVKAAFQLPFVTIYGDLESEVPISCCAVAPGSGKSMIDPALRKGAQVLITGDIGHHEGIDSVARKMAVIDGGHYGLEHIFLDFMEDYLKKKLGSCIQIVKAPTAFPAAVL